MQHFLTIWPHVSGKPNNVSLNKKKFPFNSDAFVMQITTDACRQHTMYSHN